LGFLRLLKDPSTVLRPCGRAGSVTHLPLVSVGLSHSSRPPAACASAIWICLRMCSRSSSINRKSGLVSVTAAAGVMAIPTPVIDSTADITP
jgi:hypothetical protein